jgi:GAF domain-containing protein
MTDDRRIERVITDLLAATAASRVTIRQHRPPEVFPVTHEAAAPGVPSIRDVETPNMAKQPVVKRVLAGEQVIQDDCRATSQEPHFQEMLGLYGGLRAQIVTPVRAQGNLRGIVSVHQLGRTRDWTDEDARVCRDAAAELSTLL